MEWNDETRRFCGRVVRVAVRLIEFYDEPQIAQWFETPQPLLGNRVPIELLTTDAGAAEVDAMVAHLADGAYV